MKREAGKINKVFIHKSSYVDKNVKIGEGTKVWHFSHILGNSTIGKNCVIGQNVMIGPDVNIGYGCKIQNNVSVYKGVNLAEEVFVGPSVVFTNVINPRAFIERKDEFKKIWIKKGVTIGANVTIVCGLTIGEYAFIGAGAVVTKDVPDYGLAYGNPAVLKGWMCSCGVSIIFKTSITSCKKCKRGYNKEGSKVKILQ